MDKMRVSHIELSLHGEEHKSESESFGRVSTFRNCQNNTDMDSLPLILIRVQDKINRTAITHKQNRLDPLERK